MGDRRRRMVGGRAMRRVWAVGATVACLLLAALLLAPTVAADQEISHTGRPGSHGVVDMYDSPGATCAFVPASPGSLGETWVAVMPPIVFARDETPDVDRQPVGWRPVVSAFDPATNDWHVVREGEVVRDTAGDDVATYFGGKAWEAGFLLADTTYNVTIEMTWYDPAQPERVTGTAVHAVQMFAILIRDGGRVADLGTMSACRFPA